MSSEMFWTQLEKGHNNDIEKFNQFYLLIEQNLGHWEWKELVLWFLFLFRVFRRLMENYHGNKKIPFIPSD